MKTKTTSTNPGPATNRRARVLIVEDDSLIAQLCRELLERTGGFLVGMEDVGERALESARQFEPDVILLDLNLPDRNGREIERDLRADKMLRHVPVGFITGAADEVQGEAPVMAKPFCGAQLIQFTRTMLAKTGRMLAAAN